MKKSNIVLQAAIASALLAMTGSAGAVATLSATGVSYATEQFTGTAAKTSVVLPGAISVGAGTAIPANSQITVAIALTNGLWASIPPINYVGASGVTQAGGATMSATSSTLLVPITLNAASTVGIGSTIMSVPAASATFTTTSLTSAGTPISATATVYLGSVTSANLSTATIYDGASAATTLATSAAGISISAAANTSTSKIDLTATTAATLFTSTTASATETGSTSLFKLGRVYIKDNGTMLASDGATTFATASSQPRVTGTMAASAGFFAGLGATGTISLRDASGVTGAVTNACSGAVSGVSATMTAAAAAAATSVTIANSGNFRGATTGSGWPYDVCYAIPGSGSIAQVIGTPTIAITASDAATATIGTSTLAATNMQALTTNGQSYDVRNYVPAAATGYTTYVRVINTGSLSAAVSVALVDPTTGTAGTAGVLGTLAAGAARNFTPAEIEAVTGAIAATSRPRLRITAPTSGMNVQTFLVQPNGTVSDMTGAQ